MENISGNRARGFTPTSQKQPSQSGDNTMAKGISKLSSFFNKKWEEKRLQNDAFKDLKISNLEGKLKQAAEQNAQLS